MGTRVIVADMVATVLRSSKTMKVQPSVLIASLAFFFIGTLSGFILHTSTSDKYRFLSNGERMSTCLEDLQGKIKEEPPTGSNLTYCYQKIRNQSSLDDFNIRRYVYQNQLVSDMVLLWMVVVITISGVLLAALQLYTSYQLARLHPQGANGGEGSSFELQQGRVVLKSSVTGLFIMLFSFGFFYVYVIFVYKISEPVASSAAGSVVQNAVPAPQASGPALNVPGKFGAPVENKPEP